MAVHGREEEIENLSFAFEHQPIQHTQKAELPDPLRDKGSFGSSVYWNIHSQTIIIIFEVLFDSLMSLKGVLFSSC